MQLSDVLAPLTIAGFIEGFLGREMLLLDGTQGRFECLLSWDDLNRSLNSLRVTDGRLRLQQRGKRIDPELYLAEPGHAYGSQVRGAEFERLVAAGATLILDRVDELFEPIRTLANSFDDICSTPARVNLYAGWRTDNGLERHVDGHDTMICQVYGRKRWQVFAPTRLHPLDEDDEPPDPPVGDPRWDGELRSGGALYLPRGWWHVATPMDEPSLHLTFGLSHPTGIDVLRWFVTDMRKHVEARQDAPLLHDTRAKTAWVRTLRDRMLEAWDDDVLERFIVRREEQEIPRPDVHFPESGNRHLELAPHNRLRLERGRRLHFSPGGPFMVTFRAGSQAWRCHEQLVPALQVLNQRQPVPIESLLALVPEAAQPDLRQLLTALVLGGVVAVHP